MEITARFDEAPNIKWGKELEQAGGHVAYGVERLKTHVKLALVVREEPDGIRRYVHVGTGNYVAPHNLRQRFTDLIRREGDHARAGRPCGIRAKMNQLQDARIIRELYLAGQAGVPIALNVRGLCCLRAGVPGLSDNIRVFSTLGRFLEHGRIYRFENSGDPEFFIGSADWMSRNLDKRMEAIAPVRDPAGLHRAGGPGLGTGSRDGLCVAHPYTSSWLPMSMSRIS